MPHGPCSRFHTIDRLYREKIGYPVLNEAEVDTQTNNMGIVEYLFQHRSLIAANLFSAASPSLNYLVIGSFYLVVGKFFKIRTRFSMTGSLHELRRLLIRRLPEADEQIIHAGHFEGALQAVHALGAFDVARPVCQADKTASLVFERFRRLIS